MVSGHSRVTVRYLQVFRAVVVVVVVRGACFIVFATPLRASVSLFRRMSVLRCAGEGLLNLVPLCVCAVVRLFVSDLSV